MASFIEHVGGLLSRVTLSCLDKEFKIIIEHDQKAKDVYTVFRTYPEPRVYVQLEYSAVCSKTGETQTWRGRKWYLSEFMTDDEIIKTCYAAFEACVKHEVLEGFKVDGITLFNPHVNFEELLLISHREIKRK